MVAAAVWRRPITNRRMSRALRRARLHSSLLERRTRPLRADAEGSRGASTENTASGHQAAINHHRGARDPLRIIAREVERHPGDIFSGAGARYRLDMVEQLSRALLAA